MDKSRAWEAAAIKKVFSLISFFQNTGIDYCIFDTSPGVQYSSVNALAVSDLCFIVTSADMVDLRGTKEMLKDIYENLNKKTFIILNKYSPEGKNAGFVGAEFVESISKHKVILQVPCYCEVLQAHRMGLLAVQRPEHPFVKKIEEITDKIDSI